MISLPRFCALALLGAISVMVPSSGIGREPTSATIPPMQNADWRKKLGTFRVAIIGGNRAMLAARKAQPFRNALQITLGMPVEIYAVPDYARLIEAQMGSRVEYAVHSSSSFSATWLLCKCVEPLASAKSADGSTGFRSILYARKGSFNSIRDASSKSILVPGRSSYSGYIVPKHIIRATKSIRELDQWALEIKPDAQTTLSAFTNGEGDGFFGWQPYWPSNAPGPAQKITTGSQKQLEGQGIDVEEIWRSPIIPHGPHAVRTDLPAEAKVLLNKFLINLNDQNPKAYDAIEAVHSGGFSPVKIQDYQISIDVMQDHIYRAQRSLSAGLEPTQHR